MSRKKMSLIFILVALATFFSIQFLASAFESDGKLNSNETTYDGSETTPPNGEDAKLQIVGEGEDNAVLSEISTTSILIPLNSTDTPAPGNSCTFTFTGSTYNFSGARLELSSAITDKADPNRAIEFRLQFADVPGGNIATYFETLGQDVIWIESETNKVIDFQDSGVTVIAGNQQTEQMRATIAADTLQGEKDYTLVIDKSIAGGENNVRIAFSTGESAVAPEFSATFINPVNGSRNVLINQPITVMFNKAVKNNSTKDGRVTLSAGEVLIDADYTLNDDRTVLTVNPVSPLSYGTEYKLLLKNNISAGDNSAYLSETTLTFTTQSYDIANVTADINEDRTVITSLNIDYERLGGGPKNPTIKVEIRRDLGARLEEGGTVVYIGDGHGVIDISKSFVGGDPAVGSIFVDIYILDNQDRQIGDAFHQEL